MTDQKQELIIATDLYITKSSLSISVNAIA